MKLLVVIVNYTTAKYVLQCLEKLVPQLKAIGDTELWIVDNNSPDDSVYTLDNSIVAYGLEHLVQLIKSPVNGGFGAGNNIAFRKALDMSEPPSYIYLLNPDTIPDPGTVNTLLNFMEKHPDAGVVGGALRDEQNNLQCSTFRFPSLLSEIEGSLKLGIVTKLLCNYRVPMETPKEVTPVDWVTGANMMIRRDVIEQVGMFDENFFLYWEETDLCRRVQNNAKYNIYFVPNASVLHLSGVTTGMSASRQKKRIPPYWFESRAYYLKKTFGYSKLIVFNLIVALCLFLHRVRQYLGRIDMESPHLMRDFICYNFLPKHKYSWLFFRRLTHEHTQTDSKGCHHS